MRRAATAAVVLAVSLLGGCGTGVPELPRYPTDDTLAANANAVGLPYDAWVAIRVDGRPAALHLRAASAFGDRIEWRWRWLDEPPPGTQTSGSGTSAERYGTGRLDVAGRPLEWSRGSPAFGWVYWPQWPFEVYSRPFVDEAAAGNPSGGAWLRRDMF